MATRIANNSFHAPILDMIADPIIWVLPVYNDQNEVVDFKVEYANRPAVNGLQHPKGELVGLQILKDGVPSHESAPANFQHFLSVFVTGEVKEYSFIAHHSNRQYETVRRMYEGGVLSTTRDRNEQREAERKEKEKSQLLNAIVDHAPTGIVVYEAIRDDDGIIDDFRIKLYNDVLHELTGIPEKDRKEKTFKEILKQVSALELFEKYVHIVESGEPFSLEYFSPNTNAWLQLSVVKLGDGFLILLSDINEEKKSHQALKAQTQRLSTILNSSFNCVFTCDAVRNEAGKIIDLRYTQINTMYTNMIGKSAEEVIGKTMMELFPTAKPTGAFEKHCEVIETGISQRFEVRYQGEGLDAWYDTSSVKLGDGVVVTFADISKDKQAAIEVERQKNLLNSILMHSSNGISVTEVIRDKDEQVIDARTILANDAAVQYIGLPKEVLFSKTATELDPEIMNSTYSQLYNKTLETGEPSLLQYFLELTGRWLELTISRMDKDRVIHIFTDVTSIKQAQLELERAAAEMKTVFNAAQTGMFTLLPVYDENEELIDFKFLMANPTISSYVGELPETLQGELGSKWFPQYKENGVFEMYKQSYLSGETMRQEIYVDVQGTERYLDLQCVKVGEHLLVSFTDHTELRTVQHQLEQTIEELRRSNASLEEFAYAASHDLQEPLRKIHTFAEKLKMDMYDGLAPNQQRMFDRIESATERMRTLINDLLTYSRVSVEPLKFEQVDLNNVVQQVISDLETSIADTKAVIHVGDLPEVNGDERQLRQMFQNLLGNALKYRKQEVAPIIHISAKQVKDVLLRPDEKKTFEQVDVTDNGIGFSQEYAEKIFQVFQRLHGRAEYEGTGVGLAIVEKVVKNHHGYISAKGEPGVGATFSVGLPS
ncbi:ATP-binding protein [Aridibaculum aurantiacum]|uniref:ATP-binding protein n=1 Tax=Aridibaculum aurantiacum TaxID=2810307 RepID=UPI001A960E45|nr:ATP-binding protein [Aridibaculum aurantiacum]